VSDQLALFGSPLQEPEGLRYAADFVSPAVEHELISGIRTLPLQPFQFGQFEGKRRVALLASVTTMPCVSYSKLNRSPPGWPRRSKGSKPSVVGQPVSGRCSVGWHRDKPHFDRIFGLSLGSACKFRFRRPVGKLWERYTLDAEPRSLYVMDGASRRVWEHSIPALEAPRYSITFRTMRDGPDLRMPA